MYTTSVNKKPESNVDKNKCNPNPLYPSGSERFFARTPVIESTDAHPAFAPSFA